MPVFMINEGGSPGALFSISGDDFRHLARVRRVRSGDVISVVTTEKKRWKAEVVDVGSISISARFIEAEQAEAPGLEIVLYMALLKSKNFELAIQKSVEIGVSRVVPIITERTVPSPDGSLTNRLTRWNRIAHEAAKQSGRLNIPEVAAPVSFEEAVKHDSSDVRIIGHPGADKLFRDGLSGRPAGAGRVSLLVGPEGGFSRREINEAADGGWQVLNFGFTQLRAETAALALLSVIVYEWS